MYNHDMTVTKIGKRAQIIATAKHDVTIGFMRKKIKIFEGQEFRCSGHWNDGKLVYCEISDFPPNQKFIGRDVVLDPEDFFIWVLVEFVGE